MKTIQPILKSILQAVAGAVLLTVVSVQADDKKADVNGTWTWTVPGRNGGPERKNTLKLKAEGDKLTGTLTSPGRQGATTDVSISDGSIKGEEVAFSVVRENNGNKFTRKYHGKLSGDSIKGKVEFERNGESQSQDWEAKRDSDKK